MVVVERKTGYPTRIEAAPKERNIDTVPTKWHQRRAKKDTIPAVTATSAAQIPRRIVEKGGWEGLGQGLFREHILSDTVKKLETRC